MIQPLPGVRDAQAAEGAARFPPVIQPWPGSRGTRGAEGPASPAGPAADIQPLPGRRGTRPAEGTARPAEPAAVSQPRPGPRAARRAAAAVWALRAGDPASATPVAPRSQFLPRARDARGPVWSCPVWTARSPPKLSLGVRPPGRGRAAPGAVTPAVLADPARPPDSRSRGARPAACGWRYLSPVPASRRPVAAPAEADRKTRASRCSTPNSGAGARSGSTPRVTRATSQNANGATSRSYRTAAGSRRLATAVTSGSDSIMPSAALPASPAAAAPAMTAKVTSWSRSPPRTSVMARLTRAAPHPARQKTSAYSPA